MNSADPITNPSLLRRLREPSNEQAWAEFIRTYEGFWARLLHGRLPPQEHADALQEILVELVDALPKFQYDPAKGRFRAWLQVVSQRNVLKTLRRRGREPLAADLGLDPDALDATPAELGAAWDREWEDFVMRRSLAQLYAQTLRETGREVSPQVRRLLDLMYVRQCEDAVAARKAGAKIQDVYNARRRWDEPLRAQVLQVLNWLDDGDWLPKIAPTI